MSNKRVEDMFEMFNIDPNDNLAVKVLTGYGYSCQEIIEYQKEWNDKHKLGTEEDIIQPLTQLHNVLVDCNKMFEECEKQELGINCENCCLKRGLNINLWQDGDEDEVQSGGLEAGDLVLPINPCRIVWNLTETVYEEGGNTHSAKMVKRVLDCEKFGEGFPDEDLGCGRCKLKNTVALPLKLISDAMNPIAEGTMTIPVKPCELIRSVATSIKGK